MVPLDSRRLPQLTMEQVVQTQDLRPGARGYWSDEELLWASGMSSTPMLKKVMSTGWLAAGYIPIEGGGRRRAWTCLEVIRANVLAEVAKCTLLSVQATAALLSRASTGWVDSAIVVDERLAEFTSAEVLPSEPETGTKMLLLDMQEAWIEETPGRFRRISRDMVLQGANVRTPPERGPGESRGDEDLSARARVLTTIDFSRLKLNALGLIREDRSDLIARGGGLKGRE